MISVEEFLQQQQAQSANGGADITSAEPPFDTDMQEPHADQRFGARHSGKRKSYPRKRRSRHGGFAFVPAQDAQDQQACMEAALRLLDSCSRSTGMMRERLTERGFDEQIVTNVINRLIEIQYLDDASVAQSLLRTCLAKHMGERGARQTLQRKGVDRSAIDQVLQQAREDGAFAQSAWELGEQVARKTEGLERQTRLRRFWSAGARKGHSGADLRPVADELFRDK
ncbi:regulatory protein RecX [Bifidobacterium dolichotidis]|uniref:Regulatory protein RecX n=1 Tax=Bifidobacterium dolichotidis TaxID=2306976 RepID=A0A430FSD9_9BIFI|nr:regulatory protein RecX [Bifidobacterium dolichotidis]RSX55770.1 regulatory protein RecX [Bifidobacterium dolichotidis]